jgi:two-component system sensor histidine kinase AgrC
MLNALFINSIETFNTVYLWTVLNKKDNNIYKLFSIVFILSIMNTIMQQLGLSFIFMYIIEISVIKIIYRKSLFYCEEVTAGCYSESTAYICFSCSGST